MGLLIPSTPTPSSFGRSPEGDTARSNFDRVFFVSSPIVRRELFPIDPRSTTAGVSAVAWNSFRASRIVSRNFTRVESIRCYVSTSGKCPHRPAPRNVVQVSQGMAPLPDTLQWASGSTLGSPSYDRESLKPTS